MLPAMVKSTITHSIEKLKMQSTISPQDDQEKIFFLCDGKVDGCTRKNCFAYGGGCSHTTDVKHARDFHRGLEEIKSELAKIRAKYEDPRRRGWDKKDLEELRKRDLEKERAAESVIEIIEKGNFTISECEEILLLAQKRIKFSTPVKIANPHIRSRACDKNSHSDTLQKPL